MNSVQFECTFPSANFMLFMQIKSNSLTRNSMSVAWIINQIETFENPGIICTIFLTSIKQTRTSNNVSSVDFWTPLPESRR